MRSLPTPLLNSIPITDEVTEETCWEIMERDMDEKTRELLMWCLDLIAVVVKNGGGENSLAVSIGTEVYMFNLITNSSLTATLIDSKNIRSKSLLPRRNTSGRCDDFCDLVCKIFGDGFETTDEGIGV